VKYIFIILFSINTVYAQSESAKITYIANEGFLIETQNKKVLIDALFTNGYGAFPVPSENTVNKILNAAAPFDKIDAYLLTHYHKDHSDSKLIRSYLTKQLDVKLITSKPSLVFMDGEEFGFVKLKRQFVEMTPKEDRHLATTVKDIDVKALGLKHLAYFQDDIDIEEYMFNMGFYIKMDGVGILHTGDASMETFKKYMKKNKRWRDRVDVAFVYFNMLKEGEQALEYLKKTINPKHIVIMHVWTGAQEEWTQKTEELRKYFPNLWFPVQEMDTRSLESR
jgi:L-ascorbate metabolism protein UlaG (beta-lactamase superfamily)